MYTHFKNKVPILFLSGFQPSDEDVSLLEEENGVNVPIPHYINDKHFVGLANEFFDEPVTINNAKEAYTCLVQLMETNLQVKHEEH